VTLRRERNGTRVEWEGKVPAEPKRRRMANLGLVRQTQVGEGGCRLS